MTTSRAALKPALGAGLLYLVVLGSVLAGGGGPATFVRFGALSSTTEHAVDVLGDDLVVPPGQGHDGAYFWVHAHDPLLLEPDVYAGAVERPGGRSARALYPVLVAPWGLGGETSLLWGLVLTNVALVVIGTYLTARLALDLGGPAAAGLAFALNPVILFATAMDLSDVLLCTLLVGFVWAIHRRRWGPALALAALAALTKESSIVVVAFVALFARSLPMRFRIAAPVVAASAFAAWSAYSRWRLGWASDRLAVFTAIPFQGFVDSARYAWFPAGEWVDAAAAALLVGAGVWIVVRWIRRRNLVMTAAAAMVVVLPFYDSTVYHLAYDSSRAVGASLTFLAVDVMVVRRQAVASGEPVPDVTGAGPVVT